MTAMKRYTVRVSICSDLTIEAQSQAQARARAIRQFEDNWSRVYLDYVDTDVLGEDGKPIDRSGVTEEQDPASNARNEGAPATERRSEKPGILFSLGLNPLAGADAEIVEGYPLTRCELLLLARQWAIEDLDPAVFYFVTGSTGSTERHLRMLAGERLDCIAKLVGEEAVQQMIAHAEAEFAAWLGPDHWQVFCHGDKHARQRVRDEMISVPVSEE